MVKTLFERKRKTKDPCRKCFLHRNLCICAHIPTLDLATRVVLVVHAKELKRTTNTGRLALHALINSKVFIRGEGKEALDLNPILQDEYESLLFYPSEDAIDLQEFVARKRTKPIQLIVPDGNWRQASKVSIRHPELQSLQRVKISTKNTASDHLRKEHFAEGMSTLEAIALALGLLEGNQVGDQLIRLYRVKLEATLKGRSGSI